MGNGTNIQRDVLPKEALDIEDLPRYTQIIVKFNGDIIEKRSYVENNIYVGITNPQDSHKVYVHYNNPESSKVPNDDMIRRVARMYSDLSKNSKVIEYLGYKGKTFTSITHEELVNLFSCYGRIISEPYEHLNSDSDYIQYKLQLNGVMTVKQFENATRYIMGMDMENE
jgi:hypothetical protein